MRLLDLFCGAGGCSRGYKDAGFDEIIGVDIEEMPNYPYKFVRYDAFSFLEDNDLSSYDLVHASPPCQAYSWGTKIKDRGNYPRLIAPLRELLISRGCDYVIENVVGSDLVNPMKLEGHVFGLPLVRRRLFEMNWPCIRPKISRNRPKWVVTVAGHGGNGSNSFYTWQFAMRINWMTKEQLAQAIPPKYTEYIGKEFLRWQST